MDLMLHLAWHGMADSVQDRKARTCMMKKLSVMILASTVPFCKRS